MGLAVQRALIASVAGAHEKGGHSLPDRTPYCGQPEWPAQVITIRKIREVPSTTTFPAGEQTHRAVLPQQPALESVGADTPGSRDETAHGHAATARGTGRKHGRGETDGNGTGPRRRHAESIAAAVGTAENGSGDSPTHERT
ncbi:hypothetical protein GCM10011579_027470 [Streptomyces albiflavescens]|uniref:Uncharacterized protein n=1 Tax=Streptomyces albiflavescens TaxID=1623582 RepID=A0A918D2N2_9ACTN|nr:hypothetical protein GCM10011579_027470 [Streptomyces albiflavescens]